MAYANAHWTPLYHSKPTTYSQTLLAIVNLAMAFRLVHPVTTVFGPEADHGREADQRIIAFFADHVG